MAGMGGLMAEMVNGWSGEWIEWWMDGVVDG